MTTSQKPTTVEELLAMIEEYERLKHSKHRYNLADYEVIVCACKTSWTRILYSSHSRPRHTCHPHPAALPLFFSALGVLSFVAWRKQRV